LVDQLEAQLHQGAEEAKDEFEKQKENLTAWLDSVGNKLDKAQDVSSEKAQKLKASVEELRVQAALAKAETKDEIEEQQKNIAEGIHQLRHEISEIYDDSKEKYEGIHEKMDARLDDYQTRFDLFRLQLHLGKMEAEEDLEQKKREIADKLSRLKTKLKKGGKELEGKWDEFSSEVSEGWKQIRDIK
jgi:ElaB/YqjD/DUF883 family membrane-anchored ribosome-binding protein